MNNEIRELSPEELMQVNGAGPGDTIAAIGDAVTGIGTTLLGAVNSVTTQVGDLITNIINDVNN